MLTTDIHELDGEITNNLLKRLDGWRSGICPNGKLAQESCFVLKSKPSISIHPDQSTINYQKKLVTTELITEREWSYNLVECGAMNHLNDDIMMKTMSDFFMIFHSSSDTVNNCNTLHSLQLRKHASFKVDNILRPTKLLEYRIQQLLSPLDLNSKWDQLLDIWNIFGYLWPRKLILGYKTHFKSTYTFMNGVDSTNEFFYNSSKLKDRYNNEVQKDPPFDLDHFLINATVIARQDMAPIHEFLDLESRNAINEIIQTKFVQIPVYHPIKIYNASTNSYLCWDPHGHSQQDPSFDRELHDYLVRAVSADPSELNKAPESQYIWRFNWTPTAATTYSNNANNNEFFDPAEHRSQTLRGCNNVYIYPACKSISPKNNNKELSPSKTAQNQPWYVNDRLVDGSDLIDTHKMVLSCRPYHHETQSSQPEFSKLRVLRLLANDSPQYINEKIDWTIEYPNNGLKYMTDAQVNIKLNFHEHVRRMKPLLNGDTIQLQQIGLLTAFNRVNNSSQQNENNNDPSSRPKYLEQQQSSTQSLRTAKRIIIRKPSLKSRNKKNVLCVDEDITVESWRENTFWKIELATQADMHRHSSNFVRWPQTINNDEKYGYPPDYHLLLSQDVRNYLPSHLNRETGSLTSSSSTTTAAALSLRRTRSLNSLHESIHVRDDSEKAPYFEDLVTTTKSRTGILSQIAKVSLQPLAQLMKSSRSKQQQPQKYIGPPPFSTYQAS